jgi:hypothetical protein
MIWCNAKGAPRVGNQSGDGPGSEPLHMRSVGAQQRQFPLKYDKLPGLPCRFGTFRTTFRTQ